MLYFKRDKTNLQNTDSTHSDFFQKELSNAEIKRTSWLIIIFILIGAILFNFKYLLSSQPEYLHKIEDFLYKSWVISFSVSFLYFIHFCFLQLYKKLNKKTPLHIEIGISIVEGLLPSCVLYITAIPNDLSQALGGTTSYMYVIFIILSTIRLQPILCIVTGIISSVSFAFVALILIDEYGYFQPKIMLFEKPHYLAKALVIFIISCVAAFVAKEIKKKVYNTFNEIKEKGIIENILGSQVSKEVAAQLINNRHVDLGIESEISVLFLDIRNFTSFAEKKDAKEVFSFLNIYFEQIIQIIYQNNGIINKFLGDGFMALFGTPIENSTHASDAVKAALTIIEHVNKEKESNETSLKVGIGIHSGKAYTGNIGSSLRKEYTVFGDVVNLASRIEQLNKNYKSNLLISQETLDLCSNINVNSEKIGSVEVKGREASTIIYKLG